MGSELRKPTSAGDPEPRAPAGHQVVALTADVVAELVVTLSLLVTGTLLLIFRPSPEADALATGIISAVIGYWLRDARGQRQPPNSS